MYGAVVVNRSRIDSFEQLEEATPSSNSNIVQLEPGRMRGFLAHLAFGGLSVGSGAFSHGLLSRGIYSPDRVTIGMLLSGRSGRFSANPGEMTLWPPGVEHENRYFGPASFLAVSFAPADVDVLFKDPRLADLSILKASAMHRASGAGATSATHALKQTVASLRSRTGSVSEDEAAFWKRSILSTAIEALANALPPERDAFVTSPARLVAKAQDFLDRAGTRPIHISELVAEVGVSRRTLHRAFDEVLGVGPIGLLRYRRMCSARTMLKENQSLSVADVARKHGFFDIGRFSGYFRAHFGEYPSEMRRKKSLEGVQASR